MTGWLVSGKPSCIRWVCILLFLGVVIGVPIAAVKSDKF